MTKSINQVKTIHIWDGNDIVLKLDNNNAVTGRYIRGNNLLYADTSGTVKYFLFNGHGDVTQLTSTSGNVIKSYRYDAFGNERNIDPADANDERLYAIGHK